MSYEEAIDLLKEKATILDYASLDRRSKEAIDATVWGIVPGVRNSSFCGLLFLH